MGPAAERPRLHLQAAARGRPGRAHQRAAGDVTSRAAMPVYAFVIGLDYQRRSLAKVASLPEQFLTPGRRSGIGYRIGRRRLASSFDEVVEILPLPQVTPVPGAQPWMLGLANVRGNLLPVADLKQLLEGVRTVLHEGQRMLVVRQE